MNQRIPMILINTTISTGTGLRSEFSNSAFRDAFEGTMDEIKIYSSLTSSKEISILHLNGSVQFDSSKHH